MPAQIRVVWDDENHPNTRKLQDPAVDSVMADLAVQVRADVERVRERQLVRRRLPTPWKWPEVRTVISMAHKGIDCRAKASQGCMLWSFTW
jgi:hypothetical protein